MTRSFRRSAGILTVALAIVALQVVGSANHSWGGYHWARAANPFTVDLGNNLSSTWSGYLNVASSDWSLSDVLDTSVVAGAHKRRCGAVAGRVEVCNGSYGNTGWLGVAQIWVSGLHITQGTVKLNDTYFNTSAYNTPAWRQFVVCQEVGHTFGLDHQDTTFGNANLGTCMDYTNDPDGTINGQLSNLHPNAHDYQELDIIYAHLDSFTTLSAATASSKHQGSDDPSDWGLLKKVAHGGKTQIFEREVDKNEKVVTFVIWAD